MSGNYTYIIASLPLLDRDFKPSEGSCAEMVSWIRTQLDSRDAAKLDFVNRGFVPEELTQDFYEAALSDKDAFIRSFFTSDLLLRNAKTAYLNRELGRPEGTDVITFGEDSQVKVDGQDVDTAAIDRIFTDSDLLERERAIDDFLWKEADRITLFKYFTLDNVLAVAVKLHIIDRWLSLDDETGRAMLKELIGKIRGTYGKIEFTE